MAEQQFIMTKKGYEEAKKHLEYLQIVKRQETGGESNES